MAGFVDMRYVAKIAVRGGFCLLSLTPLAAFADERISIVRGDCAAGVHLVARGASLGDVLKRLAEALGFQLQLIGPSDSIVDVDVSRQAPELIAKLSPIDNLIVTQARDPRCPGRDRVVKVLLLPKGNQGPPRTAAAPPPPRQMSEAEKQQIREGEDMYRKAHGMPPLSD
jgi:hypothetical protein